MSGGMAKTRTHGHPEKCYEEGGEDESVSTTSFSVATRRVSDYRLVTPGFIILYVANTD
jgi:hypothetical protein